MVLKVFDGPSKIKFLSLIVDICTDKKVRLLNANTAYAIFKRHLFLLFTLDPLYRSSSCRQKIFCPLNSSHEVLNFFLVYTNVFYAFTTLQRHI